MKKLGYFFVAILSFIGISSVKADTIELSHFYDNFSLNISSYLDNVSSFNSLMSYYEENFKQDYPYFNIYFSNPYFILTYSSSSNIYKSGGDRFSYWPEVISGQLRYNLSSNEIIIANDNTGWLGSYVYEYVSGSSFVSLKNNMKYSEEDDHLLIPSYSDDNYSFPSYILEKGDNFPGLLDLYNGSYERNMFEHYTEINLNNYAYVALSLKDYSLRNDNINQFSTNIYTKGQLCLTPVYDYGMKEKTEYYSGYQVDRCSVVYDDFTPVRTYILKQDLENNAIYYLKAYYSNIENKVKVDNTIFDITYISQENANNPSVSVNGRNYPTIAYDDLSSSSTESEEEGYVSGESTNVLDHFDDNFISNFFSSPLNVLKSVWGAITSMLSLVATFIALLPSILQGFLYMSFALAIILGIIKILL